MKWLSKKGSRGIAYFMIMVLVFTSVITGDVMRVKADDDDSQTTSYTCNLSVSSYEGEHGCIEYLSDEGIWETASSGGVDSVSAMAVRFSAEDGWYVSQVEYNGTTIENPANQYEFDSSGDKSVSGISFSQVDQDDENDSQDNDTDQNQAGDTDQDQDTDQDLEQNPPVYACTLNVSEYDTEHGYIEYLANSGEWTAVSADGCTATATAVRFGAIEGWRVSQIVYNDNPIDDPETDHFDFSEVGDKRITGITFEETVPARRNAPQNLRNTPPAGYCLLMGEYSTDHGKIQYSDDNGSTWTDIPYTGLAEQTPATHVRAVITTEGYGVSYEVEGSIYTDTDSHALTGDRNVQWIQRVTFSNPNKSLTVSEYDATKGTVRISTDGTTWTNVAAAGGNVSARYVKVVPENGYVLNSYSLNSNTVYSENAQELTAQNNTLSNVGFTANAGGGKCLYSYATDEDTQACTAAVTFLDADNALKGTATADVAGDIPAGTTKIRISVSEIRYLESVRVIRKAADAYLGDNNGDEIFRQEIEEALWRNGVAEFSASDAYSYKIALTFSNKKNVMWDYRESARGSDTFVEHCRLYLLDANGDEVAYHDDVSGQDTTDYVAYMLTIGNDYKFKLVPDYGYQIAGLTINDYTVAPTDDTGVFEFTMTNNNFHFAGVVTPAVDIVEAPQAYSGATLANGSRAADSGNVKMTIAEKTLDNSAAAVAGEGASAVATLDIDLNKVVSKGDGTYWSNGITEFTNNVTVSVPVPADGLSDGETYTVVRDHNNVKTKLDATYNSTTGMLTFESNKFSDYTVVKTAGTPETTPAQNVSIAVSFSGVDFVDPNDANITESAQEVITNAVPQLYLLTDSATNAYTTINPGGSFTVTPGDPVFIFVKVNSGYEVTMNETGMGLYGFFTGQWNIEEGQSAPGSGSWNRIETDGEWAGAASLSLDIKIQKKDDPGNNTNFDNLQPGLATFSAHYKDDTKSNVDILYFVDGSDDPLSVTAAGITNAANVTGFKIIVRDGYVLTNDSVIKIIQTDGEGEDHSSLNQDYVPLMDYVSEWGFFFDGNEVGQVQNTYTCDISNVSVREATPADYVGQYKLIVVTEDGLTLNGNVDTGALDASGHEIDSTYGRVSAGQAGGETGYIPLSDDSTQLFVTLNNDTDRNFFEKAVLIGKDANGTQVSSQTFDYATMRDERFVKRAINPAYSYVLTVTLSNKKRIYWTNADVANCTLHLLQAEGNTAPNPNSVRAGTDFRGVIGETYYFLMIPNYGYQVNSLNVNGNDIIPVSGDANMGIFKFVMGNGDFRIQPSLKTSVDKISNTSTQVETVRITNGAAAGVGGNLSMSVSDVATDNSAANAVILEGDGEVTAVATVNIDLKQVVEQGDGNNWNKELRELNGAITVGLAVDASGLAPGETYSVVRQHGADKTELNATYNATTGMLTFPSAAFSAYTIVKKPGTPVTDPAPAAKEETSDSSSDNDDNDDNDNSDSGSTVNTVASTLGSIVDKTAGGGLASKTVIKDWNDLSEVLSGSDTNTPADKNKKKILSDKEKEKGELVQVVLNKKDAVIPKSVFKALYEGDKSGLHIFVANGTALTFVNNKKVKDQEDTDLTCSVTSTNGSKIIAFNKYAKLKAKTLLHTTVPAGVKSVALYKYDVRRKKMIKVDILYPTLENRVCFKISELTKYELVYTY